MNNPHKVTITTNDKGRLYIDIEAPSVRERNRYVTSLKETLYRQADGLGYDPSTKLRYCRRAAHARLWAWCVAQFPQAGAITWLAVDTPEYEPARHRPPPPEQPRGSALTDAYTFFHLLPSAPLWAAEAVYRASAAKYHPDKGGSVDKMKKINQMIEVIRNGGNG